MARFRVVEKKRGDRRTGVRDRGRFMLSLVYGTLALSGAISFYLIIVGVLVPEWQVNWNRSLFVESTATVLATKLETITPPVSKAPSKASSKKQPQDLIKNTPPPETKKNNSTTAAPAPLPDPTLNEYRPLVKIKYKIGDFSPAPIWVYDLLETTTTDQEAARKKLEKFIVGKKCVCWYNADAPTEVHVAWPNFWWPWLILVMPAALVVWGVIGLGHLIWKSIVSTERRSMAVTRATQWELSGNVISSGFPTLPSLEAIMDSPGVELKYRLPIDASPNWVLGGMGTLCIIWNILVGVFAYNVVKNHLIGHPNWLPTTILVPFLISGIWTMAMFGRQLLSLSGVGVTRVEVSKLPMVPGEKYVALLSQMGRLQVKSLKVLLICKELVAYRQGTDTRMMDEIVYHEAIFTAKKFRVEPGKPFECEFEFTIPSHAMHSLSTPHNEVCWYLAIEGEVDKWPAYQRRFPIYVYPTEKTPHVAEARRERRKKQNNEGTP